MQQNSEITLGLLHSSTDMTFRKNLISKKEKKEFKAVILFVIKAFVEYRHITQATVFCKVFWSCFTVYSNCVVSPNLTKIELENKQVFAVKYNKLFKTTLSSEFFFTELFL